MYNQIWHLMSDMIILSDNCELTTKNPRRPLPTGIFWKMQLATLMRLASQQT